MNVVNAFTLTSAVALIVHFIYLRRVTMNRQAIMRAKINGTQARIAAAFVFMERARFAINLCFLLSGILIIFGIRSGGYLLALPPVLSIIASAFALRGIK